MPVNKPVYKLFEEERCFGDEIKHSTIEKMVYYGKRTYARFVSLCATI